MRELPCPSIFHDIAYDIAGLVAEKDLQYGDSFGRVTEIMKILYPDGIFVQQYGDAMFMVRVLDKLCRISTGRADPEDPDRDIVGYCLKRIAARRKGDPAAEIGAFKGEPSDRISFRGEC